MPICSQNLLVVFLSLKSNLAYALLVREHKLQLLGKLEFEPINKSKGLKIIVDPLVESK
jgi:hypothetical protein